MERNKDMSVHRTRSIQAIVSDGYRLYVANLFRIVRGSWLQGILYALCFGVVMSYFYTNLLPVFLAEQSSSCVFVKPLVIWLLMLLVFCISLAFFVSSAGFAPLREHEQTGTINLPLHWWGRWPLSLTGRVLVAMLWLMLPGPLLLFVLPILITAFNSVMSPSFSLTSPLKGFGRAAHHFGPIIVVTMVVCLVVGVASVFIEFPAFILSMANVESQIGVTKGDELDMPVPLFWFNFATFSIIGLLQAYIHLSMLFPFYYLWGSIKNETSQTE